MHDDAAHHAIYYISFVFALIGGGHSAPILGSILRPSLTPDRV